MSARLFAAFSLVDEDEHLQQNALAVEDTIPSLSPSSTSSSSTTASSAPPPLSSTNTTTTTTIHNNNNNNRPITSRTTTRSKSSKLPILPLLKALVHVECVSLGEQVQKRRVQFSGFDDSSTHPPRDSILGSHKSRANSINAMVQALQVIQTTLEQENATTDTRRCLQSLSHFLDRLVRDTDGSSDDKKRTTMNSWIDKDGARRIRKACARVRPFMYMHVCCVLCCMSLSVFTHLTSHSHSPHTPTTNPK